jgi:hypothetical protein
MRQRCLRNKRLPIVPEPRIALRAQPTHELIRDPIRGLRLRDRRLHTRRSPVGANPRQAATALVRKHRAVRLLRRVRMKTRRRLLVPLLVLPLVLQIVQRITQARTGQRRHRIRKLHRDLRARAQITRPPGKLSVRQVRLVLQAHLSGKVRRLRAKHVPRPYSIKPPLRDAKAHHHNIRLRRRGMKPRPRRRALPSKSANLPAEVKATKRNIRGNNGIPRKLRVARSLRFLQGAGASAIPFYFGRGQDRAGRQWCGTREVPLD